MPIDNQQELGLGVENALERLAADESYATEFQATFKKAPGKAELASALTAFLRALIVADSPVDRFRSGEITTLSNEARAGMWVYEGRGGCWRCHIGPNFSDGDFHNTGVGATDGVPAAGRDAVTQSASDAGKFRTPGLRMLTKTAPYMHDGSLATLEEVVQFYRDGGHANSNLSPKIKPLSLSDADASNLVAFLRALSE